MCAERTTLTDTTIDKAAKNIISWISRSDDSTPRLFNHEKV